MSTTMDLSLADIIKKKKANSKYESGNVIYFYIKLLIYDLVIVIKLIILLCLIYLLSEMVML